MARPIVEYILYIYKCIYAHMQSQHVQLYTMYTSYCNAHAKWNEISISSQPLALALSLSRRTCVCVCVTLVIFVTFEYTLTRCSQRDGATHKWHVPLSRKPIRVDSIHVAARHGHF